MSNWYTTEAEAADALAAASSVQRRSNKSFWIQQGKEDATIRFLLPATASFNYKRSYVPAARGQKFYTSPQTDPDPFVQAGLQLQATFAWWVLDRRVIEFEDKQTHEKKKVGPRVLFFADGQRTRKQLIAFEKAQLKAENEEREQDGKDPLKLEDFNLTHYDVTVSKDKGAPWLFTARRPRALQKADKELIEKSALDLSKEKQFEELAKELAPLPIADIRILLNQQAVAAAEDSTEEESSTPYSYDDEEDKISLR